MPDPGEAGGGVRLALGVEYDGAGFHGWQLQAKPATRTVQGELERALSRVANHPVRVHCAGRTDTGVHALGQVIHFDTAAHRPLSAWQRGGNSYLPDDIVVRWAREVDADFHARHRADARRYRYLIDNRPERSAVLAGKVTHYHLPLDHQLMHREAQSLAGSHDFTSYRAVACQSRTPVRDVHQLSVSRRDHLVVLDIQANAFLMHMIRNIAGVLMAVGSGRRAPGWTAQVLQARDRRAGGVTAPPDGLYFVGALYPDRFGLPGWAQVGDCAVF